MAKLSKEHDLVLAFDRHPITLAVLRNLLGMVQLDGTEVLVATSERSERKKVMRSFAPGSTDHAIALRSDAMNED